MTLLNNRTNYLKNNFKKSRKKCGNLMELRPTLRNMKKFSLNFLQLNKIWNFKSAKINYLKEIYWSKRKSAPIWRFKCRVTSKNSIISSRIVKKPSNFS
jgi:hypothetical protein